MEKVKFSVASGPSEICKNEKVEKKIAKKFEKSEFIKSDFFLIFTIYFFSLHAIFADFSYFSKKNRSFHYNSYIFYFLFFKKIDIFASKKMKN